MPSLRGLGCEKTCRDFGYDADGQKTSEVWFTSGTAVQTQTWDYDDAGRLTLAADPDGTSTYGYDAQGRVTRVDGPFGAVLTFGYDAAGNRTSVQDSKGGYSTITFDTLNRQTSEQTAGSGVSATRFDYTYTARSQVEWVKRYSDLAGTTTVALSQHQYDDAGRLTHLTHTNSAGSALAEYTYSYDTSGRLSEKVEDGTSTTYQYDGASQLTRDGAATYG